MSATAVTLGAMLAMLAAQAAALLALWLRLRFQLRRERERNRHLAAVLPGLPAGSRVHDQWSDNMQRTFTIGGGPRERRESPAGGGRP